MDRNINAFIEEVSNNLNIEATLFDEDGVYVGGAMRVGEIVSTDFEGIVSDIASNRTIFRVKYKNKHYICKISGAGKVERNYAYLISELSDKEFSKGISLSKEEFFKAVLLGEVSYFQIEKYMRKFSLEDKSACAMLIVNNKNRTDDILNIIKNYSANSLDFAVALEENQCAFIKFIDEAAGEYHSFTEYAEFLSQTIYEETGIVSQIYVGGTVKTIADLATSFAQTIAAQRMANVTNSKRSVHSYKEFIFLKMLEDLPKYKLNEYLELLLDSSSREIFEDAEMINTAEEFLENSLNVSETSRKLYLHRNTLTYRLDKIERETGLDIRKFSEALTFRIITMLSKMLK